MDAIISPADAIAAAKRFGHPAIAITDHGNVQSFPEMMLAAEKQGGVKVIYGMEAYFGRRYRACGIRRSCRRDAGR